MHCCSQINKNSLFCHLHLGSRSGSHRTIPCLSSIHWTGSSPNCYLAYSIPSRTSAPAMPVSHMTRTPGSPAVSGWSGALLSKHFKTFLTFRAPPRQCRPPFWRRQRLSRRRCFSRWCMPWTGPPWPGPLPPLPHPSPCSAPPAHTVIGITGRLRYFTGAFSQLFSPFTQQRVLYHCWQHASLVKLNVARLVTVSVLPSGRQQLFLGSEEGVEARFRY